MENNHFLHELRFFCSDNVPSLPEDVDNMKIKYIWEGRYIADYDENQDENQVDIYPCILKDKENGGILLLFLYIPRYGEG